MHRVILILVSLIISVQLLSQDKRFALIIGNSSYQHGYPLANPENDATDIALLLSSSGFHVDKYVNLDQTTMKRVIDDFGARLIGADVALVFYAGHGIQANGRNYFVPAVIILLNGAGTERHQDRAWLL